MQRYKDLSGNSGVVGFEILPDAVIVQFQDDTKYEYAVQSTGAARLAAMKRLAVAGRGLSSFISREVRDDYARKFH